MGKRGILRASRAPLESKNSLLALVMAAALAAGISGCGGSGASAAPAPDTGCGGSSAQVQSGSDETPDVGVGDAVDIVTPVIASVVSAGDTTPVRGTDGQYHVAYELLLTNATACPASFNSLTVLNAADASPVLTPSSTDILNTHALRLVDRQPATNASLPASASRVLLVTASFGTEDGVPQTLENQFNITSLNPISVDPSQNPSQFSYTAAPVPLSGPTPRFSHRHWRATDGWPATAAATRIATTSTPCCQSTVGSSQPSGMRSIGSASIPEASL